MKVLIFSKRLLLILAVLSGVLLLMIGIDANTGPMDIINRNAVVIRDFNLAYPAVFPSGSRFRSLPDGNGMDLRYSPYMPFTAPDLSLLLFGRSHMAAVTQ